MSNKLPVKAKCKICGTMFVLTVPNKLFCSMACFKARKSERDKTYHKKKGWKLPPSKPCVVCGCGFKPNVSGAKYCSDNCRIIGRRVYMRSYDKLDRARTARRQYERNKRASNIQYVLRNRLRVNARRLFAGDLKAFRTEDILGCTFSDAKSHIESLFKDGMCWERFNEIHLDHIRPLSEFDLTVHKERMVAGNIANIQPLWIKDNLQKGAKRYE
jgi:hypothetical protein